MSNNKQGICAICGEMKELTFEHIPPRSAFNNSPARPITSEELLRADQEEGRVPWDTEGLKYINLQKGMGGYYICEQCNNNTGSWYGKEYVDFSKSIGKVLQNPDVEIGSTYLIELHDIYPLRIIKQVLSMICSVNHEYRERGNETIIDLANFVRNKEKTHLDTSRYQVLMYAAKTNMMKQNPLSGLIYNDKWAIISEIIAFPLRFAVNFTPDTKLNVGVDITCFSECRYDDKAEMKLPLPVVETNINLPYDFRSKEEIVKTREMNEQ